MYARSDILLVNCLEHEDFSRSTHDTGEHDVVCVKRLVDHDQDFLKLIVESTGMSDDRPPLIQISQHASGFDCRV